MSAVLTGNAKKNIYSFSLDGLTGGKIAFKEYKEKYILIVNTASKCGFTKQYEGLEKLYQAHKDKLVVVGCPANNFGLQEPGTNEEIQEFCKKNYGVSFPMAKKISVVGKDQNALFKWLCSKKENGISDNKVQWNFTKFLIGKDGKLIKSFSSNVDPMDSQITDLLQ
jgi:glutathione peroxidase